MKRSRTRGNGSERAFRWFVEISGYVYGLVKISKRTYLRSADLTKAHVVTLTKPERCTKIEIITARVTRYWKKRVGTCTFLNEIESIFLQSFPSSIENGSRESKRSKGISIVKIWNAGIWGGREEKKENIRNDRHNFRFAIIRATYPSLLWYFAKTQSRYLEKGRLVSDRWFKIWHLICSGKLNEKKFDVMVVSSFWEGGILSS